MTYSNYKVNLGLRDDIFKETELPVSREALQENRVKSKIGLQKRKKEVSFPFNPDKNGFQSQGCYH